jgi:hypothetical protein
VCSLLNILKWVRPTNWDVSVFQSIVNWKLRYMIPIMNIACYGLLRRSSPHSLCLLPLPRSSPRCFWHCTPDGTYFSTKYN